MQQMSKKHITHIPPEDRVPMKAKVFGGMGGFTDYMTTNITLGVLWMPILNIGFGLSPALLAIVNMLLKLFDAFADPFIGNLSDNTRTRWGRRRPYIFIFAIVVGMLTPLIWWLNPEWSTPAKIAWIAFFAWLLFFARSFYAMPYYSLMLELTPNYDERTRLAAWRTLFSKLFGLIGGWVMAIVTCRWFIDASTGEPDLVMGVRWVSVGIGILIILFGVAPAIFIKERYYEKDTSHQARTSFWKSIKLTFACKPLWLLIGMVFFNLLGLQSISAVGQYVNIFLVNKGRLADASILEGWKFTAMFVAGIASIPFWTWFCEKWDKRMAMLVILLSAVAGHLLNYFCITPEHPYLLLVPAVFNSAVAASIWLLVPSMMADAADYDEWKTEKRREGSLNAVFSWTAHGAIALGTGMSGIVLQLTGFDVVLKSQTPETLSNMFWVYLLLPVVLYSASLFFLKKYNLNRERMAGIRAELEARRGKL